MKYYFDIKELFIKTVCVEADDIKSASKIVSNVYKRGEFDISYECCDDVEIRCKI